MATVTLNRPQQRNAIGDEMRDELAEIQELMGHDDAQVDRNTARPDGVV